MENARPVLNYRRDLSNGDIIQVVVWLLQDPLPGSSHSFKYRLHYQTADGSDVIRYDNERGKGDHRHIEGKEDQYNFETVKKLVLDFYEDVRQTRKNGGIG
ncbi:MAG: DUF6516 family protein [Syntrophobacteraceae bacterium]